MKSFTVAAVVFLLMFVSRASPAQQSAKRKAPVATSRLQVFFSELETQELNAIQDKDQAALNRILADDFQEFRPDPPGKPIAREDWLKDAFSRRAKSFELRQMTIRSISPQISIASFILSQAFEQAGKTDTEDRFVVDVWANSGGGDNWRCTGRYSWSVAGLPHIQQNAKPGGK
jgi:hypothetical protein